MAKNKSDKLPHYELLYIVSNKFTEDELKPIQKNVEKIITDNGGEVTFKETWGKKKLAYPINHFNHGYYSLVEFDIKGEDMIKVNTLLRMSSDIVRHQIVTKKKLTAEEIAQEKIKAEELYKKSFGNKDAKGKTKTAVGQSVKKSSEVKTEDEKVNQKELDDKLDKILETDDLL